MTETAVIKRSPGGLWHLVLGPFATPAEAHDVARRALEQLARQELLVATCPWDRFLPEHENVERARTSGAIERVTL